MGGIQAREGSLAEVHAVRGGQLILRVASSQTSLSSGGGAGGGGGGSGGGAGGGAGGGWMAGGENASALNGSSFKYLIPCDGRCYLLEQSTDVLEKIFARLSPRELALLSLTCRTMRLIVRQFVAHYCAAHDLRVRLRRFHETNSTLLLPKEVVLRERVERNSHHELLLYSARRQFAGKVTRVSFADALEENGRILARMTEGPGTGDGGGGGGVGVGVGVGVGFGGEGIGGGGGGGTDKQLLRERDVALKRDVLVVKGARALSLSALFRGVQGGGPGGTKYVAQFRMRLSNVVWNGDDSPAKPATVSVSRLFLNGSRRVLVCQRLDPSWWRRVETQQRDFELDSARVVFDRDCDWFFLRLDSFRIQDCCDVQVKFDDTENTNLKQGAIFDFIELRSPFKDFAEL